jgi:UDP-N-acetylglucosamine acyltransferase
MTIHPTAVIDKKAELDSSVSVGPYAIIDGKVQIDAGSKIAGHAYITGPTKIGKNNIISPFASVGADPQDLTYAGEPTELIIGDNNTIREYASLHRGTVKGGGKTIVGDNNLLMSYIHIAHDCIIGNGVIMANVATLAGHVEVGDCATIGGLVAIHQFGRVGKYSYIGGVSGINLDVPPFVIITGTRNRTRISGINKIGLRRRGFSKETIANIENAFRIIFRSPDLLLKDALEIAKKEITNCSAVDDMVRFFEESERGVVRRTIDE